MVVIRRMPIETPRCRRFASFSGATRRKARGRGLGEIPGKAFVVYLKRAKPTGASDDPAD